MNFSFTKFLATFFLLSLCFGAQADALSSLRNAHQAFLQKDFKKMTSEIKSTLLEAPHDMSILDNVLELYRKAAQVRGNEGLPTDWYLPDEITSMRIGVRFRHEERSNYALSVGGNTKQAKSIKQLQIIRYPDRVIIDKQAGIGEWEDTIDLEGNPDFFVKSETSRKPIIAGLYLLKLETRSGEKVDGWFLVDEHLNSTEVPVIHSPSNQEVLSSTPNFRWENFKSPQYQSNEKRSFWAGVGRIKASKYEWDEKWYLWQSPPTTEEATIGITPESVGVDKLESGTYVFVLKFSERTKFGDITISRDSVNQRTFVVKE